MKNTSFLSAAFVVLSTLVGCAADAGSDHESQTSSPIAAADTGSTCHGLGAEQPGVTNPAASYCVALGNTMNDSSCTFADGTSCEAWAFYRGECGQAHSFCELHGGKVANKIEDMGTWTASYAECTLPGGKSCAESAFAQSCGCE